MKSLIRLTAIAFLLSTKIALAQYLHTDGKIIVDGQGNEVILRGMGLGGWMLQEGYMLQLQEVANPQHQIRELIEQTIGEENTNTFYEAWLNNHCRKIDVDSLASWGFNSIRLPMHYNLFTLPIEDEPVNGEQTWLEKGFAMTDSLLSWCSANEIYLILDLHAAPGGQGHDAAISDYDQTKPSLWEDERNKQKTIALWRKLAERYSDHPWIGGYDLINETNWGFENPDDLHGNSEQGNVPLRELMVNITNAIREVDTNHIIFIEGNSWANNYNGIFPPWDDNMVASFHKYWTVNDVESIQWMLAFREQYNIPLWLGESGENSNTWFKEAITLMEDKHIGWAWWPMKKLGLNNVLEIKMTQGYQDLIDYWKGSGGQPSIDAAFTSLMELAENTKLENCIFHKDVVDAMIRQPHSQEVIPYSDHKILDGYKLFVVDFDLGENNKAYFDYQVANYHVSSGTYTAWNNGWVYRNDGVDIDVCEDDITNGYALGWTQPGEWLAYTIDVTESGIYDLEVRSASQVDQNSLGIYVNSLPVSEPITLPKTGGWQSWETTIINDVYLSKGINLLKIEVLGGEYNLNYISFSGPTTPEAIQPDLLKANVNSTNHNQILLAYNQPFNAIEISNGFSLEINGQIVEIDTVFLFDGHDQIIVVQLTSPLTYGDLAYLSYSGTSISTQNGIAIDAFTNVQISIDITNPMDENLIPGRIQVENMSINSGFRSEECYDEGGGLYLGWSDPGDYLIFDVEVLETGNYQVSYRHAGQGGTGKINLYHIVEGQQSLMESVDFNSTLGWQNWASKPGTEIFLEKGATQLKIEVVNANFNLNYLDFQLVSVPSESEMKFIRGYTDPSGSVIYLELNKAVLASSLGLDDFSLLINGSERQLSGIQLDQTRLLALQVAAPIQEGDIIKMSYGQNGTIKSSEGEDLMEFANALIKNEVIYVELIEIPGKIEVEDFSVNSGFEFEDCSDTGGGQNAGYTDSGDYLDFDVKVSETGKYKIRYRVASESAGGDLSLQKVVNRNATTISQVTFSATGGWQNWTTVEDEVTLEAGPQVLRLLANGSLFNINWIEFQKISDNVLGLRDDLSDFSIFPNPSNDQFVVRGENILNIKRIRVFDISGQALHFSDINRDKGEIHINHKLQPGLYFLYLEDGPYIQKHKLIVH